MRYIHYTEPIHDPILCKDVQILTDLIDTLLDVFYPFICDRKLIYLSIDYNTFSYIFYSIDIWLISCTLESRIGH